MKQNLVLCTYNPPRGSLEDWKKSRDQVERVFPVLASHLKAGARPSVGELKAAR